MGLRLWIASRRLRNVEGDLNRMRELYEAAYGHLSLAERGHRSATIAEKERDVQRARDSVRRLT